MSLPDRFGKSKATQRTRRGLEDTVGRFTRVRHGEFKTVHIGKSLPGVGIYTGFTSKQHILRYMCSPAFLPAFVVLGFFRVRVRGRSSCVAGED